jgi:hypothetical protein
MNTYISKTITFFSYISKVFNVDLYIIKDKTEYINLHIVREKDFVLHRER